MPPTRTAAELLEVLRPTLLAPPPPTPAQATKQRERRSAERALQAKGLTPELAAQVVKIPQPTRRALMSMWTGYCQLTGIAFGTGPQAPVLTKNRLFVLRAVADSMGTMPPAAFVALCRRVAEHADRAPPSPAPQPQPSAQPRAARTPPTRTPPAPIKQEQQHGDDFDLRAPLGLQHPDDRPEDHQRPAGGERPAGHGGGVWTWDDQRGCAVLGAA